MTEEQLLVAIGYGSSFRSSPLVELLIAGGIPTVELGIDVDPCESIAVLLVDEGSAQQVQKFGSQKIRPIVLAYNNQDVEFDLQLHSGDSAESQLKLVKLAFEKWCLKKREQELGQLLAHKDKHVNQLADVGIALSAERDLSKLLDRILTEGRRLVCCDAASLFLVEKNKEGDDELVFKLTQNDSVSIELQEVRFPINDESIVGYTVAHDSELNIADTYKISPDSPYQFNNEFDKDTGYRTVSMFATPMRNHRGDVVGVLQFINRKHDPDIKLVSEEIALVETIVFDTLAENMLRALASQSAVAVENSRLLENISHLFESFVKASVAAIEQRDPTTSGHSFRVAELSTSLARALPRSNKSRFQDLVLLDDQIKELRYAALLHDFGKVGVREHVLIKAKKLPELKLDLISHRVYLAKEKLRSDMYEKLFSLSRDGILRDGQETEIRGLFDGELEKLNKFYDAIKEANEPSLLKDEVSGHLKEICDYHFDSEAGISSCLLDQADFLALSVNKGSLTEEERKEIESHVVHTWEFLNLIPWTPELNKVPQIAVAHHEKLDGSGYPKGLHADDIPMLSKVMTISDIFDALTASDRPYKSAVPRDIAFNILKKEAGVGMLDVDMVDVFIQAEIYKVVENKEFPRLTGETRGRYQRHVCDYDLEHRH